MAATFTADSVAAAAVGDLGSTFAAFLDLLMLEAISLIARLIERRATLCQAAFVQIYHKGPQSSMHESSYAFPRLILQRKKSSIVKFGIRLPLLRKSWLPRAAA